MASGAVLDLAIGRYAGKNTGETALFRQLWGSLFPGDVVVGDRYFASYWDLALLVMCGVDSVYRQHQLRLSKRLRVCRLGRGDWLLRLPKPQRPPWLDPASYQRIPDELLVREVSFRVRVRGWRVRELTLVTTLCDREVYSLDELARVYYARWQAEVDLRSIKITMQMDVLRCKTPDMVRKEIWMHLLAYNLIRTVMAEAAERAEREIAAGRWKGPLHGIPVAAKDFFDTAGVRTTAAFAAFRDRVPARDADVITRLKNAGAILVAKTNMHELGMGTTSVQSHFGPVRNPWNEAYVAGGSSGGSAAAVAAGLCFATVDTDAIGSCRLPAAICGVVLRKGSREEGRQRPPRPPPFGAQRAPFWTSSAKACR